MILMATMTDIIEKFIKDLMEEDNSIQIQRNELANLFSCAPSQINYVLTTRFTIDRGYYIESKKGGGGYVQIEKIRKSKDGHIRELLNEKIGSQISYKKAKELLEGLKESDLINERESKLILYAIDDKSLCMPIYELKEKVRSNILKNIIIGLFSIEE